MGRAPRLRIESVYLVAAVGGIAAFLLSLSHLPFQDYPNHLRILELAATIDSTHAYLEEPTRWIFAYRLHAWLTSAVASWVPIAVGLRLLTIASAIAYPLALMTLARVGRSDPVWAGLLALPLVFSWPLKMGFLPFVLALPFAVAMLTAACSTCRQPRVSGYALMLLTALAAYCAHPLAFAWSAVGVGVCWFAIARSRWSIAALLNLSMLPVLALALWDFRNGAFSRVAGTQGVARPYPFAMNAPDQAAGMVLTHSYGLAGGDALLLLLPLALVIFAAIVAALRSGSVHSAGPTGALAGLSLFAAACLVVVPESTSTVFYFASRFAVLVPGTLGTVAALGLVGGRGWARAGALVAVSLALAMNVRELQLHASELQRLVGDAPARVDGRLLTARVADCRSQGSAWGDYEPQRHLWALALADGGVTPYLFAFAGYHPLHYRRDVLQTSLRAPRQHINSGDPYAQAGCRRANVMRVAGALAWSGFDGVIVTGRPDVLGAVIAQAGGSVERELAPGLWLLKAQRRDPTSVRTNVGTFAGAVHMGGGWSSIGFAGRWFRWAIGEQSTLRVSLQPIGTDYELALNVAPELRKERTALGVLVNGHPVGEALLEPQWQTYRFRVAAELLARDNTILLQHELPESAIGGARNPSLRRSARYAYLTLTPVER